MSVHTCTMMIVEAIVLTAVVMIVVTIIVARDTRDTGDTMELMQRSLSSDWGCVIF